MRVRVHITKLPPLKRGEVILGLDGDVLLYKIGFAAEKTEYLLPDGTRQKEKPVGPAEKVPQLVEESLLPTFIRLTVKSYLKVLAPARMVVFFSGKDNFRRDKFWWYKANRLLTPKPIYMQAIKDLFLSMYDCIVVDGAEADDALSIYANENPNFIVGTIDKDLLQVQGWNFNLNTKELKYIAKEDGDYFFWRQMLTGDTVDNIKGLRITQNNPNSKCFGNVTADKFLSTFSHHRDYDTLKAIIKDRYNGEFPIIPNRGVTFEDNFTALRLLERREDYAKD